MKIQKTIAILTIMALGSILLIASGNPDGDLEEPAYTILSGTVIDSNMREGIPDAEVTLEEAGQTTTTDEFGAFSFSEIEQGIYTVTVRADGYNSASQEVEVTEMGATIEIELQSGAF